MATFTRTTDGRFRRYAKASQVPAGEALMDLDALTLTELQSVIASFTGKASKLKDKATGRTKLSALLKNLPLTPVLDASDITADAVKDKAKAGQGLGTQKPPGTTEKQGRILEFTGAKLSSAELAAKIEACRKLSPQRASVAMFVQEYATRSGRNEFTARELREVFRTEDAKAAIPSGADQDRWRLFTWHKPFLVKAGLVSEAK